MKTLSIIPGQRPPNSPDTFNQWAKEILLRVSPQSEFQKRIERNRLKILKIHFKNR